MNLAIKLSQIEQWLLGDGICDLPKVRSVEQVIKLACPYLEFPCSFECYSVGVGTVLAEDGLAGAGSAGDGLAEVSLAGGFLALDVLVVADSDPV